MISPDIAGGERQEHQVSGRAMDGAGDGWTEIREPPVHVSTVAGSFESEGDQAPLYASGIGWIDRAYNVVRQLRRAYGLPDIRPLIEPACLWKPAATATSERHLSRAPHQPRARQKA
jgi:hypothetical protein